MLLRWSKVMGILSAEKGVEFSSELRSNLL